MILLCIIKHPHVLNPHISFTCFVSLRLYHHLCLVLVKRLQAATQRAAAASSSSSSSLTSENDRPFLSFRAASVAAVGAASLKKGGGEALARTVSCKIIVAFDVALPLAAAAAFAGIIRFAIAGSTTAIPGNTRPC
jgi:hypothetical protein